MQKTAASKSQRADDFRNIGLQDPIPYLGLEAEPVLDFMVMRVRKDWRLLTLDVEKMVAHYDQGTCRVEPAR